MAGHANYKLLGAVAGAAAGPVVLGAALAALPAGASRALGHLSVLALSAAAGLVCLRRASLFPPAGRMWRLFGASALAWAGGEAVRAYHQLSGNATPFPSLADGGFLAALGLAMGALVSFPGVGWRGRNRMRAVLDGLIVASALSIVSWATVLGPAFRARSSDAVVASLALAYPAADVILIALALSVAGRAPAPERALALVLLAGVTALAAADTALTYLRLDGDSAGGGLISLGWAAGYTLVGAGALVHVEVAASRRAPGRRASRVAASLPYVPVLVALSVGLSSELGPFLTVAGTSLVTLVVARQFLGLMEEMEVAESLERQLVEGHGELVRQQERLTEAQRVARVGSWEFETATGELSWSEELFRIFGTSPETFTPTYDGYLELLHPDDRADVERKVHHALATGASMQFEHRVVTPAGDTRWVLSRGEATISPAGDATSLRGTALDITDAKRVEEALRRSEELFRHGFEHSPIGIALVSPEGRYLKVNDALCRILGRTPDELLATAYQDITHPDDLAADAETLGRVLAGEAAAYQREKRYVRSDGTTVWVLLHANLVFDNDGLPSYFFAQVQDITERKHAELARQLLNDVARELGDADEPEDALESVAQRLVAATGAARAEVWLPASGGGLRPVACHPAGGDLAREQEAYEVARCSGEVHWWEEGGHRWLAVPAVADATVTAVLALAAGWAPGEDERVAAMVSEVSQQLANVMERRRNLAALAYQAVHDSLSGLPNRTLLIDRLQQALSRCERRRTRVAVLFVDLDRFKVVNDSMGHAAGDRLLVVAAERLRSAVRPSDTVARFGGDEFVVVCEDVTCDREAELLGERMAEAVHAPIDLDGKEIVVTVSVGIALAGAGDEADAVLRDADAAMYRAKERGRDRIELFDDGMRTRALARLETETRLRRALDSGELSVYYQPVLEVATGRVVGAEGLVRWHDPERGVIAPSDFIPVAEETGLILPLGTFVVGEACRQVAAWNRRRPAGEPLTVAVNLSARQLTYPGLTEVVAASLTASGLDPSLLCLEITESVLMEDADASRAALEALKRLGVRLGVDDFGTGYSSLLYLRRFPVDLLKIDRSFVDGLEHNAEDRAIVTGVIGLARALGLEAIAEGVEQPGQLRRLRELGCHLAQGYHWSRPLDAGRFEAWLAEHHVATTPATRVLIVDDRGDFRDTLRFALELDGPFEVVAEASDGRAAIEAARVHQPELVLLDVAMPGMSGLEALPHIAAAAPGATVVLLTAVDGLTLSSPQRASAAGVLDKAAGLAALVGHLREMVPATERP